MAPRTGRPPFPPGQRGKRINIYVSPETLAALDMLARTWSLNRSKTIAKLVSDEPALAAVDAVAREWGLTRGSGEPDRVTAIRRLIYEYRRSEKRR